jgi:hypothetical protein
MPVAEPTTDAISGCAVLCCVLQVWHGEACPPELHGCTGLGVQAGECEQADMDGGA